VYVCVSIEQYSQVEKIAIGTYQFTWENNTMNIPQLCVHFYQHGSIFAFNETYSFNTAVDHGMLFLMLYSVRHCVYQFTYIALSCTPVSLILIEVAVKCAMLLLYFEMDPLDEHDPLTT